MTRTIICARCNCVFETDRPEEEALAELKKCFCEDCWQKMLPEKHPKAYIESLRANNYMWN